MAPLAQVAHVTLTTPVSDVIDLFFDRNVRHVPVINNETLLGIISMRDLLRPLLING